MSDIGLGQIEEDKNYNFKAMYDEDAEIFDDNLHTCEYFEMSELKQKFSKNIESFSSYSHNIRSLNGHWDDILDIVNSAKPIKFSVLAFQEVWCVSKNYEIPGYSKFEYKTRDKNGPPTQIVVVGLAFLLTQNIRIMKYYQMHLFLCHMCMNQSG